MAYLANFGLLVIDFVQNAHLIHSHDFNIEYYLSFAKFILEISLFI